MILNRFDTFTSRETLPKIRIMQEHNDNSDAPTPTADTTKGSKLKVRERRIAIVSIIAASVELFVDTYKLSR